MTRSATLKGNYEAMVIEKDKALREITRLQSIIEGLECAGTGGGFGEPCLCIACHAKAKLEVRKEECNASNI